MLLKLRVGIKLLPFLILLLFSSVASAHSYIIGVLAFQPAEVAQARWQPLEVYLNKQLPQYNFTVLPLNYSKLNQSVLDGSVDFVFTNPSHYVSLEHQKYILSAMASQVALVDGKELESFGGTIFTNSDRDDISNLDSLIGKKVASVDMGSLGGFQMQAYELLQRDIMLDDLKMVWTEMPHDRVVKEVINHEVDVGFVRTGVLERMIKKGDIQAEQIKIINKKDSADFPMYLSTRLYPEWPFSALTKTNDEVIRLVIGALLHLPHESEMTSAMKIHGFTTAADYEPVREILREMKMPPYDKMPSYIWSRIWDDYIWYIISSVIVFVLITAFSIRLRVLNSQLSAMAVELDKLNYLDGLTGISNRRHFDEVYHTELKRASRRGAPIAAIMIDVDFFKDYNDLYGHQQGDCCLKDVALALAGTLKRETDVLCRYGGEEFVALLPDTSSEAAIHIAELLRGSVEKLKVRHEGSSVSEYITISLGVSAIIPDESNDAVKQADEALYCAKIKRNSVCLYDETHQKWLKSNLSQTA